MAEGPPVRLILASASWGRRQLLTQAGYAFEVMPSHVDEPGGDGVRDIRGFVQHVAWLKAAAVAPRVDQGIVLAAEELGKYKTIFQMLALHGLLLHYSFLGVNFFAGGMYFLWPSIVLSLWSAVDYHVRVIRHVTGRAAMPAGGLAEDHLVAAPPMHTEK